MILCCVAVADWISLFLFVHVLVVVIIAVVKLILPKSSATTINQSIKKEEPKVVDFVEIEDLDKEKTPYCRCWHSKKVCCYVFGLMPDMY